MQESDWQVHGRDGPTRSHPPELLQTLLDRYGSDQNDIFSNGQFLCKMTAINVDEQRRLSELLSESIHQKTAFLKELIQEQPWDLFLAVFKECHCAGHQFGDQQKNYSESGHQVDYLKKTYKEIDTAIGALLEDINDNTTVLVFSNLGMAANHPGEHLLDDILHRFDSNPLQRLWRPFGKRIYRPNRLNRFAKRVTKRLERDRKFWQIPHNEISGAVKVNPQYKKNPRRYRRLTDPVTGQLLVSDIVWPENEYNGDASKHLPDLLVIWNRDINISNARISLFTTVKCKTPNYRPGNHIPGGIFFSNIKSGNSEGIQNKPSIIDLAPTIAAALDVDTADFLGKPIPELAKK